MSYSLTHLDVSLSIVITLGVVGLVVWMIVRHDRKLERRDLTRQLELEQARLELNARREVLRRLLMQRIEFSRNMQLARIRRQYDERDMPDWAQALIRSSTFQGEEQWKSFRNEYDELYDHHLSRLQQLHPRLTEADLQLIALTSLGLGVEDISLLLDLSNRTIWNRRQRIKEHTNTDISQLLFPDAR